MSEATTESEPGIVSGLIVPGIPHPLLCPDASDGYRALADAFAEARQVIQDAGADLLIIYSTMWPSIIGHQVQARPKPEWVHVDELFHDLGSIPYTFQVDAPFAHDLVGHMEARGLKARAVNHHGFPIDTGSVVANTLLNGDNALPVTMLSSNMYSDRAETVVHGKAVRDAVIASGRRAAVVVVGTLSNRLFTDWIDPADDHVHSLKDDEWNRKMLELLGQGRLEDTAQLSREIHRQIRVPKVVNFKPMWWLSSVMGAHNGYRGTVHAYGALHGTGSAVVSLMPIEGGIGLKEFDEDDVDVFGGDRDVLA